MAVTPTIETPFEPKLPQLPVLPEVVDPDNLKQVLEEFLEYQHQLALSLRDFGRAVNADISLGHTVYPKTTQAVVGNVLEDGLCMEWTDPVALAFAKINGVLQVLTNCPEGKIIYSQAIQNSAAGGWGIETWTFPQGGFLNASVVVTSGLEGVTAHMHLDAYLHTLMNLTPTATDVTFYISEWWELDTGVAGEGPRRGACASNTVWINAMAMGSPK